MPRRVSLLVLAPAPIGDAAQVRSAVERLDKLGIDGVFASDHLLIQDVATSDDTSRPGEPFTLLAAAGLASDRLILTVMVANVAITNPLAVARAGAQLAALYGGRRVWLGIGAGWNEPEFRALGGAIPRYRHRLALLQEAAQFLHDLYRDGRVSMNGTYVRADRLPLAPLPPEPPRLLVGGGSRPVLELGGLYADVVDLNAPFRPPLKESPGGDLWAADARRRLLTTIGDLSRAVDLVATTARHHGRIPPLFSINVDLAAVAEADAVARREVSLCERWGLAVRSLAECPYVLLGTRGEIAAKLDALRRVGIGSIAVGEGVETVCEIRAAGLLD
jgi:alkanesulfonate monooxygenase SsuD/methylene tetrahydromethanopterin reductase-like flavin-dependent oxidoreductase (luciferase family)